jgi:4-amino-4-deoxy-L-arabinose transferase-like glycosyltransferase
MNIAVSSGAQQAQRTHDRWRVFLIAAALGCLFAIWCMRSARATDVTFNDQARHAMNGAAIHDMVRDGGFTRPAAYLKEYFSRYPAVSMPYHPPVFPAVEAIVFLVFGVSHVTARAAVALFVAGVAALIMLLVYSTHGSLRVAAASTVIFMAIPLSQSLAADVMLEMPAMFFVVGSLLFMRRLPEWDTRQAIGAACFAAAAVWTKQTVFAGLVPFLIICVTRRWSVMRRAPFWLFVGVFGASVLALRVLWA